MTAKPLFLYTADVSMPPELLKRVERAGYVPLAVPSFDAVKVLDMVPIASMDAISKAAFDTLKGCGGVHSQVAEDFGRRVAKVLGSPAQ